MKRIILALVVLASVASCKKDKTDITCEVSVAGIAANFKPTKVIMTAPGFPTQDVTSTYLPDACAQSGVYQLKADKSVVYTETAACGGDGTGTWDVAAGVITVNHSGDGTDFNGATVTGWDCGSLTISQDLGSGAKLTYTLTKQ